MTYHVCDAHLFPRQNCGECQAVATRSTVPAEKQMLLKLRYALRGDMDRAPFRALSVNQVLDEIERSVQGDVW